jgi:UDP-glucose 4-epimerase
LFHRQCPGTRCAAARFSNVFGPCETNPHVIPEILDQMTRGSYELALGNVKPLRDYVYVTDVAAGLVAIAARAESPFGVYNVSTGTEHSVEEIVALLAAASGSELRIVTDPKRLRPSDRMHLLCDNSRLRRETGWAPQFDLGRGLAELWSWTCDRSAVPASVS